MAPVAVAPPPLRFSFQPLAGQKRRRGCGAQSPARKKQRIECGPARKKARTDKGALRKMPVFPVSKKARPELQGSLLHARGLAAQTQPQARPRAAEGGQGFCLRSDVQQNRKVHEPYALHNGVSWLSDRVRRGRWGLGCTLCAQYWQSALCAQYRAAGRKEASHSYSYSSARFSNFAKFDCHPSSRREAKWLIKQHQGSRSHRIATRQLKASGRRRKRRVDTPSPQPCAQTLSCPDFRTQRPPWIVPQRTMPCSRATSHPRLSGRTRGASSPRGVP